MKADFDPGTLYYDGKISWEKYIQLISDLSANEDRNLVNAQKCLRRSLRKKLPEQPEQREQHHLQPRTTYEPNTNPN